MKFILLDAGTEVVEEGSIDQNVHILKKKNIDEKA